MMGLRTMITMSSLALSRITSIASGGCGTVKAGTLGFKNREDINFSEDNAKREVREHTNTNRIKVLQKSADFHINQCASLVGRVEF